MSHRTTVPEKPRVPSLENGDRLTRAEFERRYEATPHLKKAIDRRSRLYAFTDTLRSSRGTA
jgi:hypothetical protein